MEKVQADPWGKSIFVHTWSSQAVQMVTTASDAPAPWRNGPTTQTNPQFYTQAAPQTQHWIIYQESMRPLSTLLQQNWPLHLRAMKTVPFQRCSRRSHSGSATQNFHHAWRSLGHGPVSGDTTA